MYDFSKMLFPNCINTDNIELATAASGYNLFKTHWPGKPYFRLHSLWLEENLPPGYDYYIVSYHMEQIEHEWLAKQDVKAPIIVLSDFNSYDNEVYPENVIALRWIHWHHALDKMMQLFGTTYKKNITHKFSAFCNRITQSKLLITTELLETHDTQECLISLSNWVEDVNVHYWQNTGNSVLDKVKNTFKQKYLGKTIRMPGDDFDNSMNFQHHTANPDHVAYQNASLHFTNETNHYSLMEVEGVNRIMPGPHLTEKTFKCLLGGTAFIPVGQFDTYRTLSEFGLEFDYNLDLSFDTDPGNISRLEQLIHFIKSLKEYSANDLFEMTRNSTEHNKLLIVSGEFYSLCEQKNRQAIKDIINAI